MTLCTRKMLEDGADRAVVEVACTGAQRSNMKSTIVRVAPRSYDISTDTTSACRPETVTMRMKMSYAGPCTAQDAPVRLDQNSPACTQMQGQLAQMDPAKCPSGAGNAQCVESMTAARRGCRRCASSGPACLHHAPCTLHPESCTLQPAKQRAAI